MRHTMSETWSGLRRNISMTISVIMTMWVSLSLFGASLLIMQEVELVKGEWYDKIEISVFLCSAYSGTDTDSKCEPGVAVTDEQKKVIQERLQDNPEVKTVYYQSAQDAFNDFKKYNHNSPILQWLTPDYMQEAFHIKLVDPTNYQGVVEEAATLTGVQKVQDLHQVLDPLIKVMNGIRWATTAMAALLLLAAALQIGNTIRLSAFNRRREIGIMRLVGASSAYITLPFLLESLVAGILGIVCSGLTLAAAVKFFIIPRAAEGSMQSLAWIGWRETGIAMLGVTVVGVLLSIIPTLIATRKYLRV